MPGTRSLRAGRSGRGASAGAAGRSGRGSLRASARGSGRGSAGRLSPRRPRSDRRRPGAGSRGVKASAGSSPFSGLSIGGIAFFTSSSILARYFSSKGRQRVIDLPERPARPVRPMRWT